MVRKAQKLHGVRSEWNSGLAGKKWIDGTSLEHLLCSPDLTPCDFWAFPTMKMEL
jgi:hypothetical protein